MVVPEATEFYNKLPVSLIQVNGYRRLTKYILGECQHIVFCKVVFATMKIVQTWSRIDPKRFQTQLLTII